MKFSGATYTPKDHTRLKTQFETIVDIMLAGDWFTVFNLRYLTGYAECSISAQIRNAKKSPNWPKGFKYEVFRKRDEHFRTVYKITKIPFVEDKYEQQEMFK